MSYSSTLEAMRLVANLLVLTLNILWWAYTALKYRELPAKVPLHFGITGKPDWWGPKPVVFLVPVIGSATSLAMFLLSTPQWQFEWMRLIMAAVFAFLQWSVIQVAMKSSERLNLLLLIALIAVLAAPLLIFSPGRD